MSFNPFDYINILVQGGFTKEQAETQAKAQVEMLNQVTEYHLATKHDLNEMEWRLMARMDQQDRRMDRLEKQN